MAPGLLVNRRGRVCVVVAGLGSCPQDVQHWGSDHRDNKTRATGGVKSQNTTIAVIKTFLQRLTYPNIEQPKVRTKQYYTIMTTC